MFYFVSIFNNFYDLRTSQWIRLRGKVYPSTLPITACNKERKPTSFQSAEGPEKDNTSISRGTWRIHSFQTAKGPGKDTHYNQQRDLVKIIISIRRGTWYSSNRDNHSKYSRGTSWRHLFQVQQRDLMKTATSISRGTWKMSIFQSGRDLRRYQFKKTEDQRY